jgi:hypothetical protein
MKIAFLFLSCLCALTLQESWARGFLSKDFRKKLRRHFESASPADGPEAIENSTSGQDGNVSPGLVPSPSGEDGPVDHTPCNRGMANIPCLADVSEAGGLNRSVTDLYEDGAKVGVQAETWSTTRDANVAYWLENHINQMSERMATRGVRKWDPVFQAFYVHHNGFHITCHPIGEYDEADMEDDREGVRCEIKLTEDGLDDPCALDLIEAHADLVSQFADPNAVRQAMAASHDAPDSCRGVARGLLS